MSELALAKTTDVLQRGIDAGLHAGAQASVITHDGRAAHVAVGRNVDGQPMTTDLLMPWMCAARPVLALALCGLLHGIDGWPEQKVGTYLPEYASGGKEQVTIRHLLTHTTGVEFDPVAGIFRLPWAEGVRRACNVPADQRMRPGADAAYQGGSYWYVVGELITRLSGERLSTYLNKQVLRPLALSRTWIGMSAQEYAQNRSLLGGVTRPEAGLMTEVPAGEELFCTGQGPLAPRGPVRDLALFYHRLLRPETLEDLIPPRVLADVCVPARAGLADRTWADGGKIVDWNLLAMIESRKYGRKNQVFGRRTSDSAFGHSGELGVVGMCDPQAGVAAAFAVNSVAAPVPQYLRIQSICTAIMDDVMPRGSHRGSAAQ